MKAFTRGKKEVKDDEEYYDEVELESNTKMSRSKKLFFRFCLDTSLHGLKYVGQPRRHISERIFWLLAFGVGICGALYLIGDVWAKYKKSPVIITFRPFETTIDQIPFPAITICNMNKVLKSKADEFLDAVKSEDYSDRINAWKNLYYLDHVCSTSGSFTRRFNLSENRGTIKGLENITLESDQSDVAKFLQTASQECDQMLPYCLWQDEIRNCSELFHSIETEFGKCCTFNMVPISLLETLRNDTRDDPKEIAEWLSWDLDKDGFLFTGEKKPEFPRRQMRAGKSFGLSFLLDPQIDEYFCTTSDAIGFRLQAHLPIDVPHVSDFGISLRPNSEIFIDVLPDFTMADENISGFSLKNRGCYFKGEQNLKYYKYYTSNNCVDECAADRTEAKCNCVRYYMPRDNNRSLCGPSKFECAESIKGEFKTEGIKKFCEHCRPTCTELQYYLQESSVPLQDYSFWNIGNRQEPLRGKKNVSIVHVYFGSDSTYAKLRTELYGSTDLIANTGGLMGLCLGFSGLSLMEIFYFITLRAYCSYRRGEAGHSAKKFWRIIQKNFKNIISHDKSEDFLEDLKPDNALAMPSISIINEFRKPKDWNDNSTRPWAKEHNGTNGNFLKSVFGEI